MSTVRWRRRDLVKSAAAAALLAPALRPLRAHAQTAAPKRFIFYFLPTGRHPPKFWPTRRSETDFTLNVSTAPYEPFKSDMLVLDGINFSEAGSGSDHGRGMCQLLTAMPPNNNVATGISLDQVMAKELGAQSRFPSLQIGLFPTDQSGKGKLSWSAPRTPMAPELDPGALYRRVFSNFVPMASPATPGAATGAAEAQKKLDEVILRRRSVLDALREDIATLSGLLVGDERAKLEQHLTSLREIETGLLAPAPATAPGGASAGCAAPPALTRTFTAADYPEASKAFHDILFAAMACDLTRITTFMHRSAGSGGSMPWIGVNGDPHDISHQPNQASYDIVTKVNAWYSQEMTYLLRRMKDTMEGDRTMLDNSLVLVNSEVSDPDPHSRKRMPVLMFGKGGTAMKTGRHIVFNGATNNQLLVTVAQLMGMKINTFGDPSFGPAGPLPGVV
jgi:hypothetical protein